MHGLAADILDGPALHQPQAAAETLLARARALVGSGRLHAARPLLAAVRRLGGATGEADALEARLLILAGEPGRALEILDPALGRRPDDVPLRLQRVEARLLAGDAAGAARDAAEAVIAEPANARAKGMLGVTLADLDCFAEAVACLSEAVRAEPANAAFRIALARAQEFAGDPDDAAATLHQGVALAPRDVGLRNAAVQSALARCDFAAARKLAIAARQAGAVDARLFGLMAEALTGLGWAREAGEAHADALKLAPEDPYLRHMVAAAGLLPAPHEASEAFLKSAFDRRAAGFDRQMAGIGDCVPALLREAVQRHAGLPAQGRLGPVLDIGCGTGRVAAALADLPLGPWHGIDVSGPMLRQADARDVYETLQERSLAGILAQDDLGYAIAVAGNALCYTGDLTAAFAGMRRILHRDGLLVASLDAGARGTGWQLRPSGRYAHAPDHVAALAMTAGLRIHEITPQTLHLDRGVPLEGLIVVLGNAGA